MQRVLKYFLVVLLLACTGNALNLKASSDSDMGENITSEASGDSDSDIGESVTTRLSETSFAQPGRRNKRRLPAQKRHRFKGLPSVWMALKQQI